MKRCVPSKSWGKAAHLRFFFFFPWPGRPGCPGTLALPAPGDAALPAGVPGATIDTERIAAEPAAAPAPDGV